MTEQTPEAPLVKELDPEGGSDVQAFLKTVPRGEYLFLKDDLDDPTVINTWSRHGAQIFLAYLDDELAGLLAVLPGLGWSQHVGEFRMVVDPAKRGRGVGAALARQGLIAAVTAGLGKVSVEVLAEQEAVAALFTDLGFTPEALLADHVRDDQGRLHDLLVLSHPIEPTWSGLATLGMVESGAEA
jgi:ribosomal protein S18 acetylase RimI-like enzyme